ncbi:hypothetical protein [Marininema halotolerans]|uniref:Uncharacterized protein n=1 Tax=Marininema halotolerans TaxID=1155944 RepID=A0A1I6QLY6_9BACL|nr:hypothetical protein [Marininema halotolerans]SFS53497.1 hypothetical protein SAMN05444972_103240 [Marininema halotolerans]
MPFIPRRVPFSQSLQRQLAGAKGEIAAVLFVSQSQRSIPKPQMSLTLRGGSQLSVAYNLIVQQLFTSSTILARQFALGKNRNQIRKASTLPRWASLPIREARQATGAAIQDPLTPKWALFHLNRAYTVLTNLIDR